MEGNTIIMLVVGISLYYFVLVRPMRNREKKRWGMLAALSVGDSVTTIEGLIGVIVYADDDSIVVETGSEKARIALVRWAVAGVGKVIERKA